MVLRKISSARKRSEVPLRHRRPCRAQRHQHDFRGDAEPERHDAAAEAAGDQDVAVHLDVAIGELLPGRRDRRLAQHAHLAAMGMAGELQRDARGHAPRYIGLMRHQNHRRVVGDLRQRGAEIVDADTLERPEAARRDIGELVPRPASQNAWPFLWSFFASFS